MGNDRKNGIATAEDFRNAFEFSAPERVVLPKLGKPVILRRPNPNWYMYRGRLPVTLAASLSDIAKNDGQVTQADIYASADWFLHLLQAVMVQPKCVMNPIHADEISPDMMDMDDVIFIQAWASGEAVDEANSLATFRPERGATDAGAPS